MICLSDSLHFKYLQHITSFATRSLPHRYNLSHSHITGSYQQYVVTPARYTTRIPDGVSDYIAAPIMCSASTMHNSLKASGLKAGQFAVFVGKYHLLTNYQMTNRNHRRWRRSRYPRCPTRQSNGHASNRSRHIRRQGRTLPQNGSRSLHRFPPCPRRS